MYVHGWKERKKKKKKPLNESNAIHTSISTVGSVLYIRCAGKGGHLRQKLSGQRGLFFTGGGGEGVPWKIGDSKHLTVLSTFYWLLYAIRQRKWQIPHTRCLCGWIHWFHCPKGSVGAKGWEAWEPNPYICYNVNIIWYHTWNWLSEIMSILKTSDFIS